MDSESFQEIDNILLQAFQDGRKTLYEYEVYKILSAVGLDVPFCVFIKNTDEINESFISKFSTTSLILKTVSRDMAHNQRYGGVKKVTNLSQKNIQWRK